MVSTTLKLKQLISWNILYDIVVEDSEVYIYFWETPSKYHKVKLDANSIQTLKAKRNQIINFLEQSLTLSGEIVETYEKQFVTETKTIEKFIQTYP